MAPPPTPARQHTGSLTNSRFQSDLKPLIQLEVADLVFESSKVPSLFFDTSNDLSAMVPTEDEARPYIDALVLATQSAEKHAYEPLEGLLNFIVNPPEASVRHGRMHLCVLFRVYTKGMQNAYDGRGKLKPDLLCGDRKRIEPLPRSDPPVHWRVVWMSLEVKAVWPEALQQVLTYARSMLEVGDKWYALVLVYNHLTSTIRLCFATRHAVFLTPSWNISIHSDFHQFATALLHACVAYTDSALATSNDEACRNAAGFDCSRVLSTDGTLFFKFPPLGSYKFRHEIFGVPRVSGRATHVYEIERATAIPVAEDSSVAVQDPPNLRKKLLSSQEPMQSGGLQQVHHRMTLRSETTQRPPNMPAGARQPPTRPLEMPSLALGLDDPLPAPSAALSRSAPVRVDADADKTTWGYFCTNWTSGFLDEPSREYLLNPEKPIVMKVSWVPYDRLDIEIKVLKAVSEKKCFGFVRYLGHVTIPHAGMERLEYFLEASDSEDWRCPDWPNVYTLPDGKPVLFRRVHRAVYYSNTGSSLTKYAHDIIVVAFTLKDAYIALYILFTLGFLHRDPSIGNILTLDKYVRITDTEREELRKLFGPDLFTQWSSMLELQRAFLCDFDQAIEWKEKREHLPGRSATAAFLASARSTAWVLRVPFLETLPDDLEAATWTGFYSALRAANAASKKPSALQVRHYEAFNGDDAYIITAAKEWMLKLASSSTRTKPSDTDTVSEEEEVLSLTFGDTWPLWRRLFQAAVDTRTAINALKMELPGDENFCTAGPVLQKKLEEVCKNALLRYLGAVFDALQEAPFAGMMPRFDEFTTGNAGAPGTPDAPAPGSASDPDGGNPPAPPGAAGAPGASQPPAPAPPSAPRGAQSTSAPSKGGKSSAASNPPPKKSSNRNKNAPSNVQDIFNP